MIWFRLFIALPLMTLLGSWLLFSVVTAVRKGVANATGTIILYRKRPLFFIVTVIVQLFFALISLWAAVQIVASIIQNGF